MTQPITELPILYSNRDCPFCVRARLALAASGIQCELREVDLASKPQQLLDVSPKGTVPVLALADGTVIEESMDIVHWALGQSDPLGWKQYEIPQAEVKSLQDENDNRFIKAIFSISKPEKLSDTEKETDWQQVALDFLSKLERKLDSYRYLAGNQITLADICIVPFVLLYADYAPDVPAQFPKLTIWLEGFRHSDLYRRVMLDYEAWHSGMEPTFFP